jgi:hypothetical protein
MLAPARRFSAAPVPHGGGREPLHRRRAAPAWLFPLYLVSSTSSCPIALAGASLHGGAHRPGHDRAGLPPHEGAGSWRSRPSSAGFGGDRHGDRGIGRVRIMISNHLVMPVLCAGLVRASGRGRTEGSRPVRRSSCAHRDGRHPALAYAYYRVAGTRRSPPSGFSPSRPSRRSRRPSSAACSGAGARARGATAGLVVGFMVWATRSPAEPHLGHLNLGGISCAGALRPRFPQAYLPVRGRLPQAHPRGGLEPWPHHPRLRGPSPSRGPANT